MISGLITVDFEENPVKYQFDRFEDHAFSNLCDYIGSFEIPETVTNLGMKTFQGCQIKEIHIPKLIKEIPLGCFLKCDLLQNVTFDENSHLEIICEDSF